MSRVFALGHVSDLHLSTFGDTFHAARQKVRRSRQPQIRPAKHVVWENNGWRVEQHGRLRLVDPFGYVHPIPSARALGHRDELTRAAARAEQLDARMPTRLAERRPTSFPTETNTNLRFVQF